MFMLICDFHKANHLYSWKTLLPRLKNVEAVKECIRDNRGVAITMFRNGTARQGWNERSWIREGGCDEPAA
jgi:hypothetical protein